MGKFNLIVFFVSVFCDIIQFPEQGSVDFSAGLCVTAIFHVSVVQLVSDGFSVARISHLKTNKIDLIMIKKTCIRLLPMNDAFSPSL